MMYEYKVKEVVRVIDGDTVDLILDLGFGLFKKERVRIAGVDTPEALLTTTFMTTISFMTRRQAKAEP